MSFLLQKQSERDIQEIRKLVQNKKTLASVVDLEKNEIFRFTLTPTSNKFLFDFVIETELNSGKENSNKIYDIYERVSYIFCSEMTEYLVKSKLEHNGYLVFCDESLYISPGANKVPFDVFYQTLVADNSLYSQFEAFIDENP